MNLRYLSEEPDRHGNIRVYFRKRGRGRIRLRAAPGTDEFMAEYKAALALAAAPALPPMSRRPVVGTLRWLADQWYESADFKRLGLETQGTRRRQLDGLMEQFGSGPISQLAPRYVRTMRDTKADTPHAANNLLKALRVLFKWAIDADLMTTNPGRDVSKVTVASGGHHAWTIDEIKQFQARHPADTKAGLTIALLLYTGVRRSDVVRLGRQMESADRQWLRLVEMKGRGRVHKSREIPLLPTLAAVLDLHRRPRLTYLETSFGKPFTVNGFGNWFKDRCVEAGLPHCSAHGLRKAAATIAADNGATTKQLMAVFGWLSPDQAEHYTKHANRKKLGAEGARLIDVGDQKPNTCVAPFDEVSAGATTRAKKSR